MVDQIVMRHQGTERFVKLFFGDLSAIPTAEAVDLLVVSAFPNDYLPTPSSLCGALARKGISVAELSSDKAVDLRRFPHVGCRERFHPLTPAFVVFCASSL